MSEKIQNAVFLLKDTINQKSKKLIVEQKTDFGLLDKILREKKFKEQILRDDLSEEYEIKLYYKKSDTDIKWKDFIRTIVVEGQQILKINESVSESYIILLHNKNTKRFLATTGGYAHTALQDITTHDFGLEILSRVVNAEDKALRSTKERSLTGGIQGSIKFFRNDYNLFENETFGNIYNELDALLDKKKLQEFFGFDINDLKSDSLCLAKNSFTLKKSISFYETLNIVRKLEEILLLPPIVEINSVEKIAKSNTLLIQKLNEELDSKIYDNYKNAATVHSVEIGHKDFDKYYYATYSILTFKLNEKTIIESEGAIKDIQYILDNIRNIDHTLSQKGFYSLLNTTKISTQDENGGLLTQDILRNHFCSEIVCDGRSYFLIEKDWYQIKTTFIDKIDEHLTSFISDEKYTGPKLSKWKIGFKTENEYNGSHIGINNSLVFDNFTPQNIEVCDILKWDDKNIYLYHVKKGFDNSMRDLCNQVFISARKVIEDSKNNYLFLGMLYDTASKNKGKSQYFMDAKKQLQKITKQDFIGLFSSRKPIFVLTVLDTAKQPRELQKNIKEFDSNIAKFCLTELHKNLRNLGATFQLAQIWQ
jgi:uncharacterized protein (TIGR04141 family)